MKYYMFDGLKKRNKDKPKTIKIKRKMNKKKVLKTIFFSIICLFFVALITLYSKNKDIRGWFDKNIFMKEIYESDIQKIELDSNIVIENIYSYNNKIVILDQNLLKTYNKHGNEEYFINIEIKSPGFESKGKFLSIFEKNEKKLFLVSEREILWQKELEGNIKNVSINSNGYVAVAYSGTSHKTVVVVFDKNGEELFKNYLSTTNVIATSLSEDNKYLAIAEANFSGIIIQSNIKIISIKEAKNNNKEAAIYKYKALEDDLIVNIKYQNNNLICMYDSHINIIQNETNKLVTKLKEDSLFADINSTKNIIKCLKTNSDQIDIQSKIQIINPINKEENSYELESVPKKINVNENIIAVNLGSEVLFIKDNGWLIKKYKSSQEIQNVILGNEIAGIIYKNKIGIVNL